MGGLEVCRGKLGAVAFRCFRLVNAKEHAERVYFFAERPQSPIPLAFGTEGAQAASVPKVPKARDWVDWPVRIFVFRVFASEVSSC